MYMIYYLLHNLMLVSLYPIQRVMRVLLKSAGFSGRGSVAGHTVNSPSPGAKRSRSALLAERPLGEGA
jgi:hypothetical protein